MQATATMQVLFLNLPRDPRNRPGRSHMARPARRGRLCATTECNLSSKAGFKQGSNGKANYRLSAAEGRNTRLRCEDWLGSLLG